MTNINEDDENLITSKHASFFLNKNCFHSPFFFFPTQPNDEKFDNGILESSCFFCQLNNDIESYSLTICLI